VGAARLSPFQQREAKWADEKKAGDRFPAKGRWS
jgi:hypothetical protein